MEPDHWLFLEFQSSFKRLRGLFAHCAAGPSSAQSFYFPGDYSVDVSHRLGIQERLVEGLRMISGNTITLLSIEMSTFQGCLRSCYQDSVYRSCGCMDPSYARKQGVAACNFEKCEEFLRGYYNFVSHNFNLRRCFNKLTKVFRTRSSPFVSSQDLTKAEIYELVPPLLSSKHRIVQTSANEKNSYRATSPKSFRGGSKV